MREQGVDRGHTATQRRVVHRIVVHERGEVDQLHHRRERDGPGLAPAGSLMAEQQQRRAKQLPLHAQEVLVDLGDDGKVGGDDSAQLGDHALELLRHGPLDVPQGNGRDLLAHVTWPWRALGRARRRP